MSQTIIVQMEIIAKKEVGDTVIAIFGVLDRPDTLAATFFGRGKMLIVIRMNDCLCYRE
jgi:hypothetical protein